MLQLAIYSLLVIVGIGLGYGFRGLIRRELKIAAGMSVDEFLKIREQIQVLENQLREKLAVVIAPPK